MAQFKLADKLRIFGLYMGQEYLYKSGERNVLLNGKVCFQNGHTYEHIKHFDARLVLKPLSTITDEEIMEMFKLYFPFLSGAMEIKRGGKKIWLESTFTAWQFSLDLEDATFFTHLNKEIHQPSSVVQALDYLREQGYAVPYKGIDLFKIGIAVKLK